MRVRVRKSRYIKSDRTCCYTEKFNIAFSLCRALGITLYFSEGFLEITIGGSVTIEVSWPLKVTMVCFLR